MIDFREIDSAVKRILKQLFSIKEADDQLDGDADKMSLEQQLAEHYSDDEVLDKQLDLFATANPQKAFKRFKREVSKKKRVSWPTISRVAAVAIPAAAILFAFIFLTNPKPKMTVVNSEALLSEGSVLLIDAEGKSFETEGEIKVLEKGVEARKSREVATPAERAEELAIAALRETADVVREQFNSLIIPKGVRQKLTLADGTTVWLNSDSQLSFPTTFKGESRTVVLKGEAYFDVAKSDKPFIVEFEGGEVLVTGTTFTLTSYQPATTVKLYSGFVSVLSQESSVELSPRRGVVVDPLGEHLFTTIDNIGSTPGWIRGMLEFHSETLFEVFSALERWYGIPFEMDQEAREMTVNLIVSDKTPLEELMKLFTLTEKVKISLEKDKISVKKSNY